MKNINKNTTDQCYLDAQLIVLENGKKLMGQLKAYPNKFTIDITQENGSKKHRVIKLENRMRIEWKKAPTTQNFQIQQQQQLKQQANDQKLLNNQMQQKIKNNIPTNNNNNNKQQQLQLQQQQQQQIQLKGFKLTKYIEPLKATDTEAMNVHKDKLVLLEVLINNQSVIQELYKNIQCSIIQYGFHEHYKPKKKIGKGSFACVYLAEHLKTGKDFAVKAFLKEKLNEEDKGFECLYNEINMLKVLNHPNIMTLYEVWESENSYYFILNLCQHGSLTEQISLAKKYKKNLQLLKKQKSQNFEESTHTGGSQKILPNNQGLSSLSHLNQLNSTSILNQNQIQRVPPLLIKSEIKYVMKQLLSALAHTYNKQIMHRDIKPDNIMISAKNQLEVVIADFGLGTYTNQTSYIYPKCGTPGYVAPEIINLKGSKEELKNINYSAICDMFSMGATFYFLITLKQLFMGANTKETILLNKKCEIDYNSPEFKEMPSEVLDLIKKMLEIDPEKRITPQEAMEHPWLQDVNLNDSSKLGLHSQKSLKVQLEQEKFNVDETEISSDEGSHNIRKKLNVLNFQNTCFSKMSPSRSALSQIQSQFRFSDKCQSTNFNSNLNSTIEQQDRYFEKELKSFNSYNSEVQTSFRSCLSHQSSLVFKNAAYHYSKNRMLSIDDKLDKLEDETSNKNFETNLFSQHGNRLKAPGVSQSQYNHLLQIQDNSSRKNYNSTQTHSNFSEVYSNLNNSKKNTNNENSAKLEYLTLKITDSQNDRKLKFSITQPLNIYNEDQESATTTNDQQQSTSQIIADEEQTIKKFQLLQNQSLQPRLIKTMKQEQKKNLSMSQQSNNQIQNA